MTVSLQPCGLVLDACDVFGVGMYNINQRARSGEKFVDAVGAHGDS
jgi:hypothetical protein